MKKHLSLFLFLCIIVSVKGQSATFCVAPVHAFSYDPAEWQVLQTQPSHLQLLQNRVPQEIIHIPTGTVITFLSDYDIGQNILRFVESLKSTKNLQVNLSSCKRYVGQIEKYIAALQHDLLSNMSAAPEYDLAPFKAFRQSNALPQGYWWSDGPLVLAIQMNANETAQNALRSILKSHQIVNPLLLSHTNANDLGSSDAQYVKRKEILETSPYVKKRYTGEAHPATNDSTLLLIDFKFKQTIASIHDTLMLFMNGQLPTGYYLQMAQEKWPIPWLSYFTTSSELSILSKIELYNESHQHKTWEELEFRHLAQTRNSHLIEFALDSAEICFIASTFHSDSFSTFRGPFSNYQRTPQLPELITGNDSYKLSNVVRCDSSFAQDAIYILEQKRNQPRKFTIENLFSQYYMVDCKLSEVKFKPFSLLAKTAPYQLLIQYNIDALDQEAIDRMMTRDENILLRKNQNLKDAMPAVITNKSNVDVLRFETQGISPVLRCYQTNVFRTDFNQNNSYEYWLLYISNGAIIHHDLYVTGDDKKLNFINCQANLKRLPPITHLLELSTKTKVSNHLMAFYEEEYYYDLATEAVDGDEDIVRLYDPAADTAVYMYPNHYAYFTAIDRDGSAFIMKHFDYSRLPESTNFTRYKVSFIVEKDGSYRNYHLEHLDGDKLYCMAELVASFMRQMPPWQPARNIVPVRGYGSIEIGFLRNPLNKE
jgi:hypothetical protein